MIQKNNVQIDPSSECPSFQDTDEVQQNVVKTSCSSENSDSCETENETEMSETATNSLLAVLDDKNRAIRLLKRQIHNQKVQLGYYLHRALSTPKIVELSQSCRPLVAEENIQINLAINKFYKQEGMKSHLAQVYERMLNIDKIMETMLRRQEQLIRKVVERLFDYSEEDDEAGNHQNRFIYFFTQPEHVDMFSRILSSTIRLRKQLDNFRLCCDRLILIEDERNALVEQVYSIPLEQRLENNNILTMQCEKQKLQQEIKNIHREYDVMQDRVEKLKAVEESRISEIGGEIVPADGSATQLNKLLEMVNSEAVSLLTLTKDQKGRYMSELSILTEENDALNQKLLTMDEIIKEKSKLESRVVQMEGMYATLMMEQNKQPSTGPPNEEIKKLKLQLETVTMERNVFRKKLDQFGIDEQEIRVLRMKADQTDILRKERDVYKAQVNDLQAIRSAYVHVLEHYQMTHADESDQFSELEKEIRKNEESQKQKENLIKELSSMQEAVSMQETQIKHLLVIIERLTEYKEPKNIIANAFENLELNVKERENIGNINPTSCTKTQEKNSITSEKPDLIDLSQDNDTKKADSTKSFDRKLHDNSCLESNDSIQQKESFVIATKLDTEDETRGKIKTEWEENGPQCREIQPMLSNNEVQVNSDVAGPFQTISRLEYFCMGQNGKQESMRAVLESTAPVESELKSKLSLHLKCNKQSKLLNPIYEASTSSPRVAETTYETQRTKILPLDEYELMKDCSRETITVSCHSQTNSRSSCDIKMPGISSAPVKTVLKSENKKLSLSCHRRSTNQQCHKIKQRHAGPREPHQSFKKETREYHCSVMSNSAQIATNVDKNDTIQMPKNQFAKDIGKYNCEIRKKRAADVTHRLEMIASGVDKTLSQPGGKASLLGTLKVIYDTFFSQNSSYAKD